MKYSVALIMAVAAVGSSAQSLSDLPECGQGCIQRMIGSAQSLGCKADDVACLCKNPDFTYGIRDCSVEACSDHADSIINYGAEYCKANGGVVITTSGSSVTPIPTNTNGGSDGAGGAGAGGKTHSDSGDVAVATSTIKTEVDESGSSVSKTATETYYSSPTDASSSGGSGTSNGGATSTGSGGAESTNGSGNGDGNSAVNAAAPMGLVAAAGIMAMLV
ncbi:uncharacterized protein DNG_03247 [Cephalotrichum gorgonifer]|uniref:CFEM domain-containing protein n=1 Tax=Cephalotrichum gorgonifer TaxID=2041049 RepID=A0AAE8MUI4_9PEZI|nr:uncharacterized protein DNG_03247 [Cephalotrichum gorgonifer]